jgi:hypothetical protein
MHLEVLVEEPSAEAALAVLLPRILGGEVSHSIHVFQGKQSLLARLPERLRGYHRWLPPDRRIIVLVDRDSENCQELKSRLEDIARDAGFATKSIPSHDGRFRVVNRLAIEELEAWVLGDIPALNRAYTRVPLTLDKRRGYRDPDAVPGGTWEALERVLQKAGYYAGRAPKVEVAQRVSQFMEPDRNTSRSFQVFRDGLLARLT